jgi:hypothetical protein
MGSLIDFQFDGITAGYHLGESSTLRLCYGRGFESGFGNGEVLKQPADRLEDADFAGLNWDIWSSDEMLVQATVARAFNLTDGFNGLIVFPTTRSPASRSAHRHALHPGGKSRRHGHRRIILMRRDGPRLVRQPQLQQEPPGPGDDPVRRPVLRSVRDPRGAQRLDVVRRCPLQLQERQDHDRSRVQPRLQYWFNCP